MRTPKILNREWSSMETLLRLIFPVKIIALWHKHLNSVDDGNIIPSIKNSYFYFNSKFVAKCILYVIVCLLVIMYNSCVANCSKSFFFLFQNYIVACLYIYKIIGFPYISCRKKCCLLRMSSVSSIYDALEFPIKNVFSLSQFQSVILNKTCYRFFCDFCT